MSLIPLKGQGSFMVAIYSRRYIAFDSGGYVKFDIWGYVKFDTGGYVKFDTGGHVKFDTRAEGTCHLCPRGRRGISC